MSVDFETIGRLLRQASEAGRGQLYEHEVYALVRASGAVMVPRTVYVKAGQKLDRAGLESIPSDQVVLKVVSPHITHKSDVGGVRWTKSLCHQHFCSSTDCL